ncbi:MAG: 16S rRNA (guanine(527)-N(7))-methyltransferase RsmG [Stellaceae bacterium]
MARLEAYAALLVRWSERVNLVGRNTIGDLWRRHFLDSAQLFALLPAEQHSLVDLGSGAGFPGLVLSVMGASGVELIESDGRKCAFLHEAVRLTGAPAMVRHGRIEAIPARASDVVTARACAPLEQLLPLAERFIGPHTSCVFLKGGRSDEELAAAQCEWSMTATQTPSLSDRRGIVLRLEGVVRA